jgi:hypothetical protein
MRILEEDAHHEEDEKILTIKIIVLFAMILAASMVFVPYSSMLNEDDEVVDLKQKKKSCKG